MTSLHDRMFHEMFREMLRAFEHISQHAELRETFRFVKCREPLNRAQICGQGRRENPSVMGRKAEFT